MFCMHKEGGENVFLFKRRMVKIFCMCEKEGENVLYAEGGW